MSECAILFSSDDEDAESAHEMKQYNSFTAMLKGVPPPSSITLSKFTVEDILKRYKDHHESFGFGFNSYDVNLSSKKNSVFFINYLNSSQVSEDIASLMQKVQGRYVQLETLSSCNLWFNAAIQSCGSAKKRLRTRQGTGLSPGRRLSHLARRRQFFSRANLQSLANLNNVKQIEIKKTDKHRLECNKVEVNVEKEKLNSFKRALFLSPENGTPTKYGNIVRVEKKINSSSSDETKKIPLQERSKKNEVLKWLSQQNFEVDLPRKRLREECANHSQEQKRKCPRRSLNFADEDVSHNNKVTSDSNNSTEKKPAVTIGKLSQNHKNKLLWAVSIVLKENSISRNHENFKTCASTLFHKCRRNLDEILNMQTATGTSEKILQYARTQIPSIFEELGIKCGVSTLSEKESHLNCSYNIENNDESKDDTKENIKENNIENNSRSASNSSGFNKDSNVFKTPRKVCRKRVVKSCQKGSNPVDKKIKKILRRWHSLESLVQRASAKFGGNDNEMSSTGERKFNMELTGRNSNDIYGSISVQHNNVNSEICSHDNRAGIQYVSDSLANISDPVMNDGDVFPQVPDLMTVDAEIVFSPIPSSVKEENESDLYPALRLSQNNNQESELPEVNSISSEADDSKEILNQDEIMGEKLRDMTMEEGIFPEDCYTNFRDEVTTNKENCISQLDNNVQCADHFIKSSIAIEEQADVNRETHDSLLVCSAIESIQAADEKNAEHGGNSEACDSKQSLNEDGNLLINNSELPEKECDFMPEVDIDVKKDSDTESNEKTDIPESDTTAAPESGTYKPRKLVVKKTKPNWKVIRKNSEEAENGTEIRLKMRLSHEWEVVCRNSSCSDIGNNSECESSMNSSQVSSSNDGKDLGSELEESNRSSPYPSKYLDQENVSRRESISDRACHENKVLDSSNPVFSSIEAKPSNAHEDNSECEVYMNGSLQLSEECSEYNNLITKNEEIKLTSNCKEVFNNVFSGNGSSDLFGDMNKQNSSNISIGTNIPNATWKIQNDSGCHTSGKNENNECNEPSSEEGDDLCSNIERSSDTKTQSDASVPDRKFGMDAVHENSEKNTLDCSFDGAGNMHSSVLYTKKSTQVSLKRRRDEKNVISSTLNSSVKIQNYATGEADQECNYGSAPYDSESGSSSASNDRERKKRLLSLENYKARKLEQACNDLKFKIYSEQAESKQSSSEEKADECNDKKKKIYHIRLKHPIGEHKHRHKNKYRDSSTEKRKHKHKSKRKYMEKLNCEEISTSQVLRESASGKRFNSLCGSISNNEERKVEEDSLVDGSCDLQKSMINAHGCSGAKSNSDQNVNIQTIVNALSTLSKLVEQQIKLENENILQKPESSAVGENVFNKKSKWLEVVSSWCGKNLNNLKQHSNSVQLSFEDLDGCSLEALKQGLSLIQAPETKTGNSDFVFPVDHNHSAEIIKESPARKKIVTIPNTVKDHNEPVESITPRNEAFDSNNVNLYINQHSWLEEQMKCNISELANTSVGNAYNTQSSFASLSDCSNSLATYNNIHNELGWSSGAASHNSSEGFSGTSVINKVQDCRHLGAGVETQAVKLTSEMSSVQQMLSTDPVQPSRDSSYMNAGSVVNNAWSAFQNQGHKFFDPSPGVNMVSSCGEFNTGYSPNGQKYPLSFSSVYQYPNNVSTMQQPSNFYPQNIIYNNYTDWKLSQGGSSWNYHQTAMTDELQNTHFFPFQVSNQSYYYNNY